MIIINCKEVLIDGFSYIFNFYTNVHSHALQFFNLRVAGPPIISHPSPRALCLPHLDSDRSQQVEGKWSRSHSHAPVPHCSAAPSQPAFRSKAASYFGTLISSDHFY